MKQLTLPFKIFFGSEVHVNLTNHFFDRLSRAFNLKNSWRHKEAIKKVIIDQYVCRHMQNVNNGHGRQFLPRNSCVTPTTSSKCPFEFGIYIIDISGELENIFKRKCYCTHYLAFFFTVLCLLLVDYFAKAFRNKLLSISINHLLEKLN